MPSDGRFFEFTPVYSFGAACSMAATPGAGSGRDPVPSRRRARGPGIALHAFKSSPVALSSRRAPDATRRRVGPRYAKRWRSWKGLARSAGRRKWKRLQRRQQSQRARSRPRPLLDAGRSSVPEQWSISASPRPTALIYMGWIDRRRLARHAARRARPRRARARVSASRQNTYLIIRAWCPAEGQIVPDSHRRSRCVPLTSAFLYMSQRPDMDPGLSVCASISMQCYTQWSGCDSLLTPPQSIASVVRTLAGLPIFPKIIPSFQTKPTTGASTRSGLVGPFCLASPLDHSELPFGTHL